MDHRLLRSLLIVVEDEHHVFGNAFEEFFEPAQRKSHEPGLILGCEQRERIGLRDGYALDCLLEVVEKGCRVGIPFVYLVPQALQPVLLQIAVHQGGLAGPCRARHPGDRIFPRPLEEIVYPLARIVPR